MATKLDKSVTRESTVQINGREILATLADTQEIKMRLKGMKSGEVSISILNLFEQLSGKSGISAKENGMVTIDNSSPKPKDRTGWININDFRSQVLISADLDLPTKTKMEAIIVKLISQLKK